MESRIALQQQPRSATLVLPSPRTVLAGLLLVLLSGLPQIGMGLSGIDFGSERISGALPVTRSVMIDRLLPEVPALVPPHVSDFPPALEVPPPLPFQLLDRYTSAADEVKPSPWLLNLTERLYRQQSSYV